MVIVQSNPMHINYGSMLWNLFHDKEFVIKLAQKVSHMMMNIHGLIMEDPEHTIHLRTLQFATHNNPGSEIEMEEIE
jgi:hypothetical protein